MKDKSKKTQEIESFFSSQIIDEGQSQIPAGYEVVKKYPLHPPFICANFLSEVLSKSASKRFKNSVRGSSDLRQLVSKFITAYKTTSSYDM